MHKHQNRIAEPQLPDDIAKAWAKWFEEVDRLEVMTKGPIANLSYTKSYIAILASFVNFLLPPLDKGRVGVG